MAAEMRESLDREFAALDARSRALLAAIPADKLYWQPAGPAGLAPVYSCGEHLLRSAAAVEQTCGGISVNLWDDPFEWTLPEALPAPSDVLSYLEETEETRRRAFLLIGDDTHLTKEIMPPSGAPVTLGALLLETLVRAAHHQGRAYATHRLFSNARLPHI